ncbi:MAG: hypothetical protein R3325_07770, partial [Thermoanaerobaculia bacterium]|nr:hypothetical protein [Thermoanaerobaculia bacterium]
GAAPGVLFLGGAAAPRGAAPGRATTSWPLLLTWVALLSVAALAGRATAGTTLATTLVALSLLVAVGQSLVFLPNRAERRDLRPAAERFAAEVPPDETVWVFGPADCAGHIGSLFFYMGRDVVTLPSPQAPPAGSYGLLMDWQGELLPSEIAVETVALTDTGRHRLVLVRVLENSLPQPAAAPGLPVGDLCLCRFFWPTPPPAPRPPWRLAAGLANAPPAPDPARGLSCDDPALSR